MTDSVKIAERWQTLYNTTQDCMTTLGMVIPRETVQQLIEELSASEQKLTRLGKAVTGPNNYPQRQVTCINCSREIHCTRTLTGPAIKNQSVEVWTHVDTGYSPCDQAEDGIDRWPSGVQGRKYAQPALKHVRATHPPDQDCGPYGCNVCNLFICSVCGGAEGSLTTHCPGYQVPPTMSNLVYAGAIDFVDGQWVVKDELVEVFIRLNRRNPIAAEPGDL
jgi:hypothetical protein